jgi:hypothetical protein
VERDFYCETCHYTWPRTGSQARQDPAHGAPYYFIDGIDQTPSRQQTPNPTAEDDRKAA